MVTATRPSLTIRILFFGLVGRDNVQVGDLAFFWNFLVVNEEHGVGVFDATSETNEIRSPRVARGFLPDATWGGRTHASQGI